MVGQVRPGGELNERTSSSASVSVVAQHPSSTAASRSGSLGSSPMEPSKPRDSIGPTEPAPETVLPPRARRVAYVTSPELTQLSSYLPSNIGRSRQVHDLVHALGLLEDNDCDGDSDNEPQRDGSADEEDGPSPAQLVRATVRSPIKATRKDIGRFHDHDYVGQY